MSKPELKVVASDIPAPPYPPDTSANGWHPELHIGRITASDTWTLAEDDERPWLLRIWMESWLSTPVGSLPACLSKISARIGCSVEFMEDHADALLSEWALASDGLLYCQFVTDEVLRIIRERETASGWERAREIVISRDGLVCRYCGTTEGKFHVDHVFPRSRGGSNDPENLVVACAACNMSKGARTPEEWQR